jgi:hypothetical protein
MTLPCAPLERRLQLMANRAINATGWCPPDPAENWSDGIAARILHTSKEAVRRYRRAGLSPWLADRCATHLNLHPIEIWGGAWVDACAANEAERDVEASRSFRRPWTWPDHLQPADDQAVA